MATPSKRRKTNSHKDSPQPIRSLDYFFASQKAKQQEISVPAEPCSETRGAISVTQVKKGGEDGNSTDEQLARKLQEEWDAQDRDDLSKQSHQKPLSKSDRKSNDALVSEDASNDRSGTVQAAASTSSNLKKAAPNSVEGTVKPARNTLALQSSASAEDVISSTIPFDESPMTFDPSRFLPDLKKCWADHSGEASYGILTRCFIIVNSTQSRIKIVDTLVNFLRTIIEGDPGSLLPAVWLATNAISPPYISLELGLGGAAISKALKNAYGLDNASLKALHDKHGDAGDVAFEAKKRQTFTLRKPKPLSIKGVFQ
ncbi:MAG: hypothetical protein Q9228_007161, partial [Teloschistes exilis]